MTTYEPPAEATTEPRVRWCDRDDAHPAHERRNQFGGKDYCTGMSEEAAARGRPSPPAPAAEHPCGDYPAPCNCDDPETHDGAVPATERDALRAEVEGLRDALASTLSAAADRIEAEERKRDEARQQVADLRTGIEALVDYAAAEVADAKAGETYAAEVNQGVLLASEQARRWAWETVLRKVSALLDAQGREADEEEA